MEIRSRWGESYDLIDSRTLNHMFLGSLKSFFKDKSLNFGPALKEIFAAIERKEKAAEPSQYTEDFW